ncbi:MAG: aquaporin [Candidatus Hydrogenedentes bacterium]|nr:aquaporin [Candidatus Hydrogenedentota bacterium]
MVDALRKHWPEYIMEAGLLGAFMASACGFGALFYFPGSGVARAIDNELARRFLMGVAMGLTAIALIYSPWGKRSGAHMNPAVTLTFLRLGKVAPMDAAFYVLFQFSGGALGVFIVYAMVRGAVSDPNVNYVVTVPGKWGVWAAFAAEAAISFGMMAMVLATTNRERFAPYTGLFAGALLVVYITFEAPLSGMSINPARTFGSALVARQWTAFWIYAAAPLLGMLAASEWYLRTLGAARVNCAKLHHRNHHRCIFCEYQHPELAAPACVPRGGN